MSRRDKQDRLWASVLFGLPGFIDASEASRVHISPVHRLAGDPLDLAPGCLLGTYCIDLATRQRCRQNGVLAHHDAERITMDVRVAFASCPKFIQGTCLLCLLCCRSDKTGPGTCAQASLHQALKIYMLLQICPDSC